MRSRHQGDLVWRFQLAEEELGASSTDAEARLATRDRIGRIDGVLARLSTVPVGLARVLALRYGPNEALENTRSILRELAGIAPMTIEATTWFERVVGRRAAEGSSCVHEWLESLCGRIYDCDFTGADGVLLDEIRRGSEDLLREAESAYEQEARERATHSRRPTAERAPPLRPRRTLKAFYTVPELACALGMSRWTVRRWLDEHRIPYEQRGRRGGARGGRIIVLVSELRTYAPSYFASIREELEVEE